MKKFLAMLLAATLCISLCACGAEKTETKTETSTETSTETNTETSTAAIKVGMVTDVGGVNDQSFNQSSWEGLTALAASNDKITVKYLESKTDADYAANIQTFIDEEYDLIICVGFMLADATMNAAQANPNQKFAIIDDSTCADLSNVACLMFSQEQASYLVGVAAGMMTKSNTIGYVQGMVSPVMNLFGIGYIAGAKSVNPDVKVLQFNANAFGDAAIGNTAATEMVSKGADVIYHAAGGTGSGVISACHDNNVWAIGVDADQSNVDPCHVITSAMKRVDTAAQNISLDVLNGTYVGGVHTFDLSNGGVDIAPTRDLLPAEVIEAVEAAKKEILSGAVVVPTTNEECPEFELQ